MNKIEFGDCRQALPQAIPIDRREAARIIIANHYTHRFPSGWTRSYSFGDVVVVFSIPANKNLERFIFERGMCMRELARLWAPDGHAPFALTQALSAIIKRLRHDVPECQALVSFADPNKDHHGGIYQAASWVFTGQSSESRVYLLPDGTPVSRRAFHSGSKSLPPSLPMVKMKGKLRYVRFLSKHAKKAMKLQTLAYPKPANDNKPVRAEPANDNEPQDDLFRHVAQASHATN